MEKPASKRDDRRTAAAHVVLVHGAGHGAWCWHKLRRLLEDSGRRVTCVDLAGDTESSVGRVVMSLEEYDEALMRVMSSLPEVEKVVLVGHSAGGSSVMHALHEFGSEKISLAIFLAAVFLHEMKEDTVTLSHTHHLVDFEFGMGPNHPPTTGSFKKGIQRELLYHLCPQEVHKFIRLKVSNSNLCGGICNHGHARLGASFEDAQAMATYSPEERKLWNRKERRRLAAASLKDGARSDSPAGDSRQDDRDVQAGPSVRVGV